MKRYYLAIPLAVEVLHAWFPKRTAKNKQSGDEYFGEDRYLNRVLPFARIRVNRRLDQDIRNADAAHLSYGQYMAKEMHKKNMRIK